MKPDLRVILHRFPGFAGAVDVPPGDWPIPAGHKERVEAEAKALLALRQMPFDHAFAFLCDNPPSAHGVLGLIEMAMAQARSEQSRNAASQRNAQAKQLAQQEWKAAKAADPTLIKRAFADQLVPRLEKKPHLLTIRPETIAFTWLKGL